MTICVYCESPLPERALFCSSCAKQARCKECKDLLESNAKACVICGTFVGQGDVSVSSNEINSSKQPLNTLELKETKTSRDLKVAFMTDAIAVIGDAISHILVDRLGNSATSRHSANSSPLQITGETISENKDYIDAETNPISDGGTTSLSQVAKDDREKLHDVFHYNNDVLKLDYYNLKATGQLDAAKRLVCLFLYAHELEGRTTVTRDAINAVLKDIDLFDGNISNWISTTPDLAQEGDESMPTFRLRKNGRDFAKAYLADIFNPEKKDEWSLTEKAKSRKKSKSSETVSDGQSGSKQMNKKSSEVDSWVMKWKELKLNIDPYSVISSTTTENKGIIALWAIRKATSDERKVVKGNAIATFISKAFSKDVDRSTLVRAMEQKAVGRVRRVTDGYELTDEGVKHAEALLDFKSTQEKSAPKAKNSTK